MPNPVKSLEYIKCYSSNSPIYIKALAISSKNTAVDQENLIPNWKSEKKAIFLYVIIKPIIYKFFEDFTNHRKKTITFLNTGTKDENFQQSAKQYSFRHIEGLS